MKSFSQREGLRQVKNVMQINSMNKALKNRLWNLLYIFYWDRVPNDDFGFHCISNDPKMYVLFQKLRHYYFKLPLDTLRDDWPSAYKKIREWFFKYKWYEVYDFIEFIANNYPDDQRNSKFISSCNKTLECELSAYRFVAGKITPITSRKEITEIKEALEIPLKPVHDHLKRAQELFADRKSPDYRNSIKESISAVEAICRLIAGKKKTTLGEALKIIEKKSKVELHPALEKAFDRLYGYTNDTDGIRHALLEESNLDFEDAKFMLVSCSAFINYLVVKSSKAGIEL